jgi:hypothetical protein
VCDAKQLVCKYLRTKVAAYMYREEDHEVGDTCSSEILVLIHILQSHVPENSNNILFP